MGDRGLKGKSRLKLGKEDEDDGVREGVEIGRAGESLEGEGDPWTERDGRRGLTERRKCGTGRNRVRGGEDQRGWWCIELAAAVAAGRLHAGN